MIKLFFNYVNKVSTAVESSLLHHTSEEQKAALLPWYSKYSQLDKAYSSNITPSQQQTCNPSSSSTLHSKISALFKVIWSSALKKSSKLSFYAKIKQEWGTEQYLAHLPFDIRKHLTRIRISSHRLQVETGRYSKPALPREERFCDLCKKNSNNQILLLGDEKHLIYDCLANKKAYDKVPNEIKMLISKKETETLFTLTGKLLTSFGIYIKDSYNNYLNYTPNTNLGTTKQNDATL